MSCIAHCELLCACCLRDDECFRVFPSCFVLRQKTCGAPLLRPADPHVTLKTHEVVDHFQTKGSSYPAGTDGSPTPKLFERTKEVSNRKKKKKKKSTTTCILPHPPSASSPVGPSGAVADACSKCASLAWEAFWRADDIVPLVSFYSSRNLFLGILTFNAHSHQNQ